MVAFLFFSAHFNTYLFCLFPYLLVDTGVFLAKIIVMTLQTYDPKQLDHFALRLLDLAAIMRHMANRSRDNGISDLALHDKKASEWCSKLEQWAHKTQADLEVKILQNKAEQRAHNALI